MSGMLLGEGRANPGTSRKGPLRLGRKKARLSDSLCTVQAGSMETTCILHTDCYDTIPSPLPAPTP